MEVFFEYLDKEKIRAVLGLAGAALFAGRKLAVTHWRNRALIRTISGANCVGEPDAGRAAGQGVGIVVNL